MIWLKVGSAYVMLHGGCVLNCGIARLENHRFAYQALLKLRIDSQAAIKSICNAYHSSVIANKIHDILHHLRISDEWKTTKALLGMKRLRTIQQGRSKKNIIKLLLRNRLIKSWQQKWDNKSSVHQHADPLSIHEASLAIWHSLNWSKIMVHSFPTSFQRFNTKPV